MTQTVYQITSLNWKEQSIEMTHIKRKYVDLNQAVWPSGLRRQTHEIHQSRILVHERVRGFDSHSCQKTFWTRWGRADKICHTGTSIRDDSPKQKKKQKTRNVIGRLIADQFKSAQKRGHPAETCKTRLYARVWMQMFPNRWHKPFSRLHLWIDNVTQLKGHRSKGNMST